MDGRKQGVRPLTKGLRVVAFWGLFGLSVALLIVWTLDTSGDPATRGLGRAYALFGSPFLVLGLALFLLSNGAWPRVFATVIASAPLLFLALLFASARFGYLFRDYLRSPTHRFQSPRSRELGSAVERNDLSRIRELIAAGADPNERGSEGLTPLSFALDRKRTEAALLLLNLGADPTLGRGDAGRRPINEIVATDDLTELLEAALAHGTDPNFVAYPESGTLLHWAIASRARKNVERLVAAGARLDTRDDAHSLPSPLSYALDRRLWSYARFLVEHGAPLQEASGYNGLATKFANADPPSEGDPNREDYVLLLKAMRERGFTGTVGRMPAS